MPHILVTNDDGIHAPGLRALAEALNESARSRWWLLRTSAAPRRNR